MPQRKEKELTPLETAALFCIIVGVGMVATTYSGILDLFQGYLGGIILLVVGATLFAYEKAPEETAQVYRSLLDFLFDTCLFIMRCQFELNTVFGQGG